MLIVGMMVIFVPLKKNVMGLFYQIKEKNRQIL